MFCNHNGLELEISNKNWGKFTSMQKLSNIPLNNQWIKEELKHEIIKFIEINETEDSTNITKYIQLNKIQLKQYLEIWSFKCLY